MSRYSCGLLVALTIGGCAGKNTVAGQDKTKAEQLEESLPSWCQSICQRIDTCAEAVPACDCQGDACDCSGGGGGTRASCPSECEQEMARYTNDTCAVVGENLKRCIDTMTCEDFNGSRKCEVSNADKKRCPGVDDSSETPPSAAGGGAPASGGTGPVPDPGTGAAGNTGGVVGGAAGGTLVSCSSSYGTGGGAGMEPASSAVICEEGRDDCNDGHEYSWICARGSEGQLGCSCFVDSEVTGGFDPQSADCPSPATVNAGCHWNIAL